MAKSILLLCCYKSLYGGNFIPSLCALEDEVNRRGGRIVYAFPTGSEERDWIKRLQSNNKSIKFFDFNSSSPFVFAKRLNNLVSANNIDIVHAHHVPVNCLNLYSLLHPSIRVITHLHSDFTGGTKTLKQEMLNYITYHILSYKNNLISVSSAFTQLNPAKITWIPNALAHYSTSDDVCVRNDFRKLINVSDDTMLLLLFGWSPTVKGLDIAVEAVSKVYESGQNVALLIVCGREMTPNKIKGWISEHTNIKSSAPFLRYLEPMEEVFKIHEASDIMLSCSRSEGFPYSILEALSCGKPVVTSSIAGVEWCRKYSTTYFFESQNVSDCVAAINKACSEIYNYPNIEIAAKVKQDYSINTWVNCIIQQYQL